MNKPTIGAQTGAVPPARLEELRARATKIAPGTGGAVSDHDNLQVLFFGRHQLAINETVIAVPMSLILATAAQIVQGVSIPAIGQAEAQLAAHRAQKKS